MHRKGTFVVTNRKETLVAESLAVVLLGMALLADRLRLSAFRSSADQAVGTAANARRGGFCPLSGKYSTHPYRAWSSRIGGKASSGAEYP
jgi:hypothetical protein